MIKGCAREAGERTKIAVQSCDRYVDSVGACVGMKGLRVQSIMRELRGEYAVLSRSFTSVSARVTAEQRPP